MTDPHLTALALGSDLTNLGGLDLNSNEVLYPTFTSPWSDRDGSAAYTRRRHHRERHFELPKCYYVQPPALKTSHLAKFTLETLFYIFYNMPRDTLQEVALLQKEPSVDYAVSEGCPFQPRDSVFLRSVLAETAVKGNSRQGPPDDKRGDG